MAAIHTFNDDQIATFRQAGVILRDCLSYVSGLAKAGVTTLDLDQAAEAFILERGGKPAFKGYHGFTGTLCTSVNEECVHGLPGQRTLQDGDIIALDCGVLLEGLYTDACVTVPVGRISSDAQRLLDVTKGALDEVIPLIKAGTHTGDISHTIQVYAEDHGFKPVVSLTGHGLGTDLHLPPDIPNIGKAGSGPQLPANTVIAVEPILSAGADRVRQAPDGWTYIIADGGWSAHFEHTILVLDDGCEVLA